MLLQVALLHLQTTKRATARSSSSPSAQSIARWRTDACSGSADIRRVRSQRMSGTRCSEQPEATSGRAPRCPFDDAFRYATARVVPPRFRAASTRATSHRSLDCSASGSSPTGAPVLSVFVRSPVLSEERDRRRQDRIDCIPQATAVTKTCTSRRALAS